MNRGAIFSNDRNYRYVLWRIWDAALPKMAWIGLNPSTADETKDDPTIRRCASFAFGWGYGGIIMLNLFAFRATDPKEMKAADYPVGSDNDRIMEDYIRGSSRTVAAWGIHGNHNNRANDWMSRNTYELHCLGVTKAGHPKHPLYISALTMPVVFSRSEVTG